MKMSLKTKLVLLLVATGVVPLLAGLIFIVHETGGSRRSELAHRYVNVAEARAETLQWSLHEHIALVVATARNPFTIEAARTAGELNFDAKAAADIDARWQAGEPLEVKNTCLAHPLAEMFRGVLQGRRRQELFVTDSHGRVFACGHPTSDYLQADELWWQRVYNNGKPQVYISPAKFDESVQAWSIDVCVAIVDTDGKFLGVCKAVIDLGRWLHNSVAADNMAHIQQVLLDSNNVVVYGKGYLPYKSKFQSLSDKDLSNPGGWIFKGSDLYVRSEINLGHRIERMDMDCPEWILLLQIDSSGEVGVVRQVMLTMAGVGVLVVLAAFFIGLTAIDAQVLRPLQKLRLVAAGIANGQLDRRVELEDSAAGSREIAELMEDFNRMAEAVEQSHSELELAYDMKNRFVRVAGHELKTPLAYILAMAALMGESAVDPRVKSSAASIENRARRLDSIISGMLKLSAGGRGVQEIDPQPCDTDELFDRATEAILPFVTARGQNLKVTKPQPARTVKLDEGKILDVLQNLLGNAVKFTPDQGTVTLRGEFVDGQTLRIDIQDQGSGISEHQMRHLFEPFWGATDLLKHSSGDFEYEKRGAGLGLPVAKHFVELHGGTIEVSNSGEGCVFSIILPVAMGD